MNVIIADDNEEGRARFYERVRIAIESKDRFVRDITSKDFLNSIEVHFKYKPSLSET